MPAFWVDDTTLPSQMPEEAAFMETYIAALDQGTTSSRAILFNRAGEIVSRAQHPFRQIYPQPGWVEHDPLEIWATEKRALAEVVGAAHIDPKPVSYTHLPARPPADRGPPLPAGSPRPGHRHRTPRGAGSPPGRSSGIVRRPAPAPPRYPPSASPSFVPLSGAPHRRRMPLGRPAKWQRPLCGHCNTKSSAAQ